MRVRPFEDVVAEHGATVLRVCRAVVGPVDAEDAWSETFLSALRAYPELPADANVEAWLVTIAHRRALDVGRARTRRAIPVDTPPDRPSARADPAARYPDLWAALQRLPDKQRLAVAYHHIAGLPFAEIAELLGNSPDAARRAAADGIKTLRKTLSRGRNSMSTNIFDELQADDETLARLHQRLERDAATDELLDVAYRTVDSPVGTLLLAATTVGLVRVAYDIEGHDAVLAALADVGEPARAARACSAGRRRAPARRVLRQAAHRPSTCRSISGSPTASAAASSSICATSATAAAKATRRWPRPSATPARSAPSAPPAPTTRCPS